MFTQGSFFHLTVWAKDNIIREDKVDKQKNVMKKPLRKWPLWKCNIEEAEKENVFLYDVNGDWLMTISNLKVINMLLQMKKTTIFYVTIYCYLRQR